MARRRAPRNRLNSLITLEIGERYQEDFILHIKSLLQANHGALIRKESTMLNWIKLSCKKNKECPYLVEFSPVYNEDDEKPYLYELHSMHLFHLEICLNIQEAYFLKRSYYLDRSKNTILRVMKQFMKNKKNATPLEGLEYFLQQQQKPKNYISGPHLSTGHKRKLKKKWDNILLWVRKSIRLEIAQEVSKNNAKVEQQQQINQKLDQIIDSNLEVGQDNLYMENSEEQMEPQRDKQAEIMKMKMQKQRLELGKEKPTNALKGKKGKNPAILDGKSRQSTKALHNGDWSDISY